MPRNHHVAHKGGVTVTVSEAPRSFHTPSLLEPFTRNVYLPGGRFV
jgi:hypothetical protein